MKAIQQLRQGFANLPLRQRVTAIVSVAVVLVLAGNLLLLQPQRVLLTAIKNRTAVNHASIEEAVRSIADLDSDKARGVDRFAKERSTLSEYKRQIAEADAFFTDTADGAPRIDGLLRNLLHNDPELTLESLKILPVAVFYAPPAPVKTEEQGAVGTVLSQLKKEPKEPTLVLSDKTLYKHGVEVTVRGRYPALVAYLERVQGFRQRLFWSEAGITTTTYPDSRLRLVVNTLSDQPVTPLN